MGVLVIRTTNGELYHHGILGQKWGVRRYQKENGQLTAKGKAHSAQQKQKIKKAAIAAGVVAAGVSFVVAKSNIETSKLGKEIDKGIKATSKLEKSVNLNGDLLNGTLKTMSEYSMKDLKDLDLY